MQQKFVEFQVSREERPIPTMMVGRLIDFNDYILSFGHEIFGNHTLTVPSDAFCMPFRDKKTGYIVLESNDSFWNKIKINIEWYE